MKRSKWKFRIRWFLIVSLILCIAVALVIFTRIVASKRKLDEINRTLRDNVVELSLACDDYIAHNPQLPTSIEQVLATGYIESLPVNPYTNCVTRILEPGEPASLGDIVFIPRVTTTIYCPCADKEYGEIEIYYLAGYGEGGSRDLYSRAEPVGVDHSKVVVSADGAKCGLYSVIENEDAEE